MPLPFRRLADEFEKARRDGSWRRLGALIDRNFAETTAQLDQSDPAGRVVGYAGTAAPAGWLLCDGSEVNRSTYARLFAVVGETYGAGDGSTTFNVPDLRDRLPKGPIFPASPGGTGNPTTSGSGHTHTVSGNTDPANATHNHTYHDAGGPDNGTGNHDTTHDHPVSLTSGSSAPAITISGATYLDINFIVRT